MVSSLDRFYKWQADPEDVEEAAAAEAAADSTPAPATPVRGSRPLPAVRVTRAAEKRLEAEDELLTPDAHAAAAASLRTGSRGAAAEPRAAAHRAQQHDDDTWQAADELVRIFLVVTVLCVHTCNITVI
jgi:hypothetical protein